MSYILEALRKAERERSLGQVPSIELGAGRAAKEPRQGWLWLLVGALLVNAGVLAAWLWFSRDVAVPPVAEMSAPAPAPAPPAPAVADYLPPSTMVMDEPVSEPPVVRYDEPVREPPPPVAERAQPRPPPPEPGVAAEDAFDEPTVYEGPVEDTPVAEEPPLLRDMPAEFRRRVPEMKIDAHFYTDVPGRSFVMINLRKYKPGERLSEGPQLIDIVEGGVILSYQGQEFLLTP